jgi:hypothetical protein
MNYLEFIRLALDFSVEVLQSETTISNLKIAITEAEKEAEIETQQLSKLSGIVNDLLDSATDGESTEILVSLRDHMKAACQNEARRAQGTLDANLQSFIARSNSEIERERAANVQRMEKVLTSCDFPDTEKRFEISMNAAGGYAGTQYSVGGNLLHAEMQLSIPSGNIFNEAIRVDAILPDLQINLPDSGGFLKRSNKIVPHKLSKEYVTAISNNDNGILISLRNAPREGQPGYDILFRNEDIQVVRISKQQEFSEPYTVEANDRKQLFQLFKPLYRAAEAISWSRERITSLRLNSEPLATYKDPTQFVLWILAEMTPVVQSISRNTLAPNELVLKRVLSDDKREEVFLSKSELAEKLTPLTAEYQQWFAPLGLDRENQNMDNLPTPVKSNIIVPKKREIARTVPIMDVPDIPEPETSGPRTSKVDVRKETTSMEREPLAANESAKSGEGMKVVVESEKSVNLELPEEQTSELDLTELDEDASAPAATRFKSEAPTTRVRTGILARPSGATGTGSIPPVRPSTFPVRRRSASAPPPPPPRPSSAGPSIRPSVLPDGSTPSKAPAPPKRDSLSPLSRDALEKRQGDKADNND